MREEVVSFQPPKSLPLHTALKLEIAASGIRQFVIAQRLSMSEGQLSKILTGRRPLDGALAERIRAAIAEGPVEAAS